MKELELEANNYVGNKYLAQESEAIEDFIAGATSKYAESEKLKFAINELQKQNDYNEGFAQEMCLKRILELQQKLNEINL